MPSSITRPRVPPALRGWVLPVLLAGLWWWATASNESTSALLASLRRNAWGLLIGGSAGLILGGLLGGLRWLDRLLGPSFHTLKQISLFAWIPMLSMWFGLGDDAKIAFIAMAAFFPMVINTLEGLRSVPREYIELGRVYRFSLWQQITRVLAPSAAPSVFTGLQLALIYSWLATLGSEYLMASGQGLGNTLVDGREHGHMDLVMWGMLVIGSVGYALNALLARIEKSLLAWREQTIARY